MRILMMGTGPFAVPTFRWLLDSPHDVPALVTRPAPAKRPRRRTPENPMLREAQARDLPVLSPESINSPEAHEMLHPLAADLFVVCDYGQILSADTLSITPRGGINLHGSLLPKYRGAAPVNWAIYNGETETGVTVIHMTPRLDSGPMIAQRKTEIGPSETAVELERRLAQLGVEAVREAIDKLAAAAPGESLGDPQDKSQATKAPRLTKDDGLVDWSRPAHAIFNQVRALKPWPGTFSYLLRDDEPPARLILDGVTVVEAEAPPEAAAGEVVHVDKDKLLVATGAGLLSLERVQPAGKRVMTIDQWLRGHVVEAGDRFGDAQGEAV